jgi:type II secretory pathway predicted ATPase ExeA
MNPEMMDFFGLVKPFSRSLFLETAESTKLLQNIKRAIDQGGIIALTGMVGSGKTTLLRKIQEQLLEEKKVSLSRSLSTDKKRVTIGTLYTALFMDLMKEKNFQAPTQPEKRERKFLEILKKNDKPVVLFVDEAHDLHSQTLISLKRLTELVYDSGRSFAVVIAGHPKLKNDLNRPSMEEVGARSQLFTLNGFMDNNIRYCEWLLRQCGSKDTKPQDIIVQEAMAFLANSLVTPLQINHYLTQALEKAYMVGIKPIPLEVIQTVLAPDIDGLEAKLARNGYNLGSLCEVLNAKTSEVKTYLRGQLTSGKVQGFNQDIHKLGIL